MNPYPTRIDDLHTLLGLRYSMHDKEAIDLVIASQLDSRSADCAHPWIVLETDYPARTFTGAWFAFGGALKGTRSMADVRAVRPRAGEPILNDWLRAQESGETGLLIDSEWRRAPTYWNGRTKTIPQYAALLSRCVRLRVSHPRVIGAHDEQALKRAALRVLDDSFRAPAPVRISLPASFAYWCELTQRLAPAQTDWEALTSGCVALARRRAHLYNREVNIGDWQACARILRDTVPALTAHVLQMTTVRGAAGAGAYETARRWSQANSGDRAVYREIDRLISIGVLAGQRVNERSRRAGKGQAHVFRLAIAEVATLLDRDSRLFA